MEIPGPNEVLISLRSLATRTAEAENPCADLVKAVELFGQLDEWLSKGGALPAAWARLKPEQP